jgi:hypothetical protein
MSSRSGYQPIAQSIDEVDEADVGEGNQASSSRPLTNTRGSLRRPGRPGSIDLTKLDNAFKR